MWRRSQEGETAVEAPEEHRVSLVLLFLTYDSVLVTHFEKFKLVVVFVVVVVRGGHWPLMMLKKTTG